MLERLGAISPRNQRILLILGCAVLFCVWFVRVPLIEPDETRYTEATREMVASANYIIPHYNFEHRFQKPIFYYWVQSAARIAFGPSEAAARFPSALFAIAMVFLLHGFLMRWLRRWAGKDNEQKQKVAQGTAFLGAISLAILPLIAIWTRVAVTDITLTFFITGALISLLQASLEEKRPTGWYLLAAFFCGMAFLTKGPIGIAIPGLVWLVFHIRQKTILSELRRVPWVLAILILLAINLPWYLSTLYTKDGSGFLRQFFLTENFDRYAGGTNDNRSSLVKNIGDLIGFLLSIVMILFPFHGVLLRDLSRPFAGQQQLADNGELPKIRRFAWIWIAVVVVVFSFSQTRFLNYVQSISVAVIIISTLHLLGRFMPGTAATADAASHRGKKLEQFLYAFFGVVWIAAINVVVWKGFVHFRVWSQPYPEPLALVAKILVPITGAGVLTALVVWLRQAKASQFGWLMTAWGVFLFTLMITVIPMFVISAFGPVATVGRYIKQLSPNDHVMTYVRKPAEDLVYYGERKVVFTDPKVSSTFPTIPKELKTWGSVYVVTDEDGSRQLTSYGKVETVKQFPYLRVIRLTEQVQPTPKPVPVP